MPHTALASQRRPGKRVQALRRRFFGSLPNPLRDFRKQLQNTVTGATRILDIGCGRTAPVLSELVGIRFGVDLVPHFNVPSGIHVVRANAEELPFENDYFDVVVSTSVLEHIERPELVIGEIARVLRPGGRCFILTPNKWDYISVLARIIPNRLHGAVVRRMTGRLEEDTFPTLYRANTARTIQRLATSSGGRCQ